MFSFADIAGKVLKSKWTWYALLLFTIIILWRANEKNKAEAKRQESNYEAKFSENQKTIQAQKLTLKEMEEYYAEDIKKLRDSLGVKPKQVVKYQYLSTERKVTDTVTIHDTIIQSQPFFVANYSDFCADASFLWIDGDSTGTFHVTTRNKIYVVDYWERNKLLGVKVFPRWGRKQFFIDVISECSGDTILENRRIERE